MLQITHFTPIISLGSDQIQRSSKKTQRSFIPSSQLRFLLRQPELCVEYVIFTVE